MGHRLSKATMKQANFLWKNNRGIYFFRSRIPKQFAEHFPCSEIKKSLQTDSYRLAVKLARAYRVELDKEMEKLKKGAYSAFTVTLEGKLPAKLPDGSDKLIEGKITRDIASPDETTAHKEFLLAQLRAEVERTEKQAREQALFEAKLAAIQTQAVTTPPLPTQTAPQSGLMLADAIQQYITDRTTLGAWNPKTATQNKTTLRDFLEIVGNLPITQISRSSIADFRQQYIKLPKNRRKDVRYREKTLQEILAMPNVEPMDLTTVDNNLGRITPFFNWCVDREYLATNPATGITKPLPKKKSSKQDRSSFTHSELQLLFGSKEYQYFNKRFEYWTPIIALYHGMRLEEICKLQLSEIKCENGVWCFEIVDAKTRAGCRQVPIHRILTDELDFLSYVQRLKAAGETQLFPELTKGRDGYGARVSKWFARYRQRCGIEGTNYKKCFHSFRHTVVDQLRKVHKVEQPIRLAILGHEPEGVQDNTYGSDYDASDLKPYLDLIDYGITHPKPYL